MSKNHHVIIGLTGKQGSGKTTLAKELVVPLEEQGFEVVIMKYADPLYEIHNTVLPVLKKYGFVAEDCTKDGDLLQILGTQYVREKKGEDSWVNILRARLANYLKSHKPIAIIIEDARFENEFRAVPEAFWVRLDAPREIRKSRTHSWREDDTHRSEIGLDEVAKNGEFDLYLDTSTTGIKEVAKIVSEKAVIFKRS